MERYFQYSVHALVLCGFGALVRTGRLDVSSIGLFLLAYAASLNQSVRKRPPLVRGRGAFWLSLAYIVFFPIDGLILSRSFVSAVVHLIVFLLAIKLAQEKRDKDYFYLILLSFLLLLAASSLTVELSFVVVLLLFIAALVSTLVSFEIRRAERAVPGSPSPRIAGRLGSLSLWTTAWIALVGAGLFFILPRFGTGYFTRADSDSLLLSGFSESVELGEIGQVKLSSSLVMRTRLLDGALLAAPKWRGVALDTFDGNRWSTSVANRTSITAIGGDLHNITPVAPSESAVEFEIFLEPLATSTLFGPHQIRSITGNFPGLEKDQNDSVFMRIPPNRRIRYQVTSVAPPRTPPDEEGSGEAVPAPPVFDRYLQLPEGLDTRIVELAESVTSPGRTTFEKASLLELYLKRNYAYSLDLDWDPGDQPLATFLFEARRGHCEYFASSMAIMLRAVGIPTRIVNGFLPGEFNTIGRSYIVRQSDAHSWVEVWVRGPGWVEFDPTPPGPGDDFSMSLLVSHYLDAFELFWNSYVLTYDSGTRALLFSNAGDIADNLRTVVENRTREWMAVVEHASDVFFSALEKVIVTALFWSVVLAAVLIAIAIRRRHRLRLHWKLLRFRMGWTRPDRDIVSELFQRAARMATTGRFARQPQETWREWVRKLPPGPKRAVIGRALDVFEKATYGGTVVSDEEFSALQSALEDLKDGAV